MQTKVIVGLLPGETGLKPVEIRFGNRIESVTQISTNSSLPLLTSGLVDSHTHGILGTSVQADSGSLVQIATDAASFGVTRTILSLVSSDPAETLEVLRKAEAVLGVAGFSGIHLEGPFLAPARCGAHRLENLRAATDSEISDYLESDAFASITVAPEQVSIEQTRKMATKAKVAVGHTDCEFEAAKSHFEAGASVLTHALNAMKQLESREPGPLGAALEAKALVEIIADGHHLHPATVKALFEMADRPVLVTDSIEATGLGDIDLKLGEVAVAVRSGVARRVDNGALAGSTLTLNQAVANCVRWGVDLQQAIAAASSTPARHYGLGRQEVAVGEVADLVLWQDFSPLSVYRSGDLVHGSLVG